MSEEKQVKTDLTEELKDLQSQLAEIDAKEEEEAKTPLTPDQRIEVLQEISVLTGVLNTVRHIPKWDMGNKGKQERKITGSIPLNFFEPQQNAQIAQRIVDLINLL